MTWVIKKSYVRHFRILYIVLYLRFNTLPSSQFHTWQPIQQILRKHFLSLFYNPVFCFLYVATILFLNVFLVFLGA